MNRHILTAGVASLALALGACDSNTTPANDAETMTVDNDMDDAGMANEMGDEMASGDNAMVGGAEMFADKPIAVNASAAPNLSTLVSAVTQAGLVETLSGPGPFTVFAPTNDAFAKVPKATLDGLMAPAQRAALGGVLKYHVVPGTLTAADLSKRIADGNGKATLKTVQGENLTLTSSGGKIRVAGMGGSSAVVSQADVRQSNGVVHVVDGVLTPSM